MNSRHDTPARRAEDNDRLASWNATYDRYSKIVSTVLFIAATWFVAHVWNPIQSVPLIQAQVAEMAKSDTAAVRERADMKEALKILVRMQCLQLSAIDRAKIGLDCTAIPIADVEAVERITKPSKR
jgi:hypothetical protein